MPIFNDLNLDNWKKSEILTDSLWIIPERDKTGKHNGFYHGNFIPQIPHQLILRYTKKNNVVFDPFLGSGTTAYEVESLSYNNEGLLTLDDIDDIKEIMSLRGKYGSFTKEYNRFKADKLENRNYTANKTMEYLHYVTCS